MTSPTRSQPRLQFSSCCGVRFPQTTVWPRICPECGNPFWDNPIPVVVILQPVINETLRKIGVLLVRRAIHPCLDELALPGGYQEIETWREAASRELREETGHIVPPEKFRRHDRYAFESSTTSRQLLLFAISEEPLFAHNMPAFKPNKEVSECVVVYEPTNTCFSTHTEAVKEFFRIPWLYQFDSDMEQ